MLNKKKITIRDVAQAAGVSTQTVSRVINNRPDVSSETRARVQQVIESLGYNPNILARSLSRGRSNTIGVVGYGLVYFGSTSVLTGVEQKANELGFSLILSLLDKFEPNRMDAILNDLLSRQVDGILWAVPGLTQTMEWLADNLQGAPIPVVFINKCCFEDEVVVAMDNRMGGRLATEHLLEHGYRRIGIITGPTNWWEAEEREAGWREVLGEAGIGNLDDLKVVGDWTAASGDVGLHNLYAKAPDIDAVFASNDQMALGALQAARRIGLQVPEDLGMVGFDDIPEAAYFYPALSTVRQNAVAVGAQAVEQLKILIQAHYDNGEYTSGISWIRPRLIIRKSSIKEIQLERSP